MGKYPRADLCVQFAFNPVVFNDAIDNAYAREAGVGSLISLQGGLFASPYWGQRSEVYALPL